MRPLGSYLPLESYRHTGVGAKLLGKLSPLLRLLCRARCRTKPVLLRLHALRVVNDGAIGSRAGNRWETQVHKVSLLPGTQSRVAGRSALCWELRASLHTQLAKKSAQGPWVSSTNTYLRNSSALSAAEISVTPPLGTCKKKSVYKSSPRKSLGFQTRERGSLDS